MKSITQLYKVIIVKINLFFYLPVEKQAFEVLIFLKYKFQDEDYLFNKDNLSRLQLEEVFDHRSSLLTGLGNKDLKNIFDVLTYLKDEGYLESSTFGNYKITHKGLLKINQFESPLLGAKKFLTFISFVGGLVYALKGVIDFCLDLIITFKGLLKL